jgi:DNA-binding transcriptional LysR family regulator
MRITELEGRPLVMFRRGYDVREATLRACRASGFEPELAVEGGEMDAVLRFVEAGLGLAVVPSMVLKNRHGLRGTPLARPRLLRTVALARRKDVEPSHSAEAFQRHLYEYLLGLTPERLGPDLEVLIASTATRDDTGAARGPEERGGSDSAAGTGDSAADR